MVLQIDQARTIQSNIATQGTGAPTDSVRIGLDSKPTKVNLRAYLSARGINPDTATPEQIKDVFTKLAAEHNDFVTVTTTRTNPKTGELETVKSTYGPPGTENVPARPKATAAKESAPAPGGASALVGQASTPSATGADQIQDASLRTMVLGHRGTREITAGGNSNVDLTGVMLPEGATRGLLAEDSPGFRAIADAAKNEFGRGAEIMSGGLSRLWGGVKSFAGGMARVLRGSGVDPYAKFVYGAREYYGVDKK